jgi:hypothetical protein
MELDGRAGGSDALSPQLLRDLRSNRTVFGKSETQHLDMLLQVHVTQLAFFNDQFDCGPNVMVGLMFFYVRLSIQLRFWPVTQAKDILAPAGFIAERLSQVVAPNAITHHFAGLAAHVLMQMADFTDTRDEAERLLDRLERAVDKYVAADDSTSYDALVRDVLAKRRARGADNAAAAAAATAAATAATASAALPAAGGLQHLAAAAMAEDTVMEDGGVAAAAEAAAAAAAAAQAQMGSGRKYDGELMDQGGYMNALMKYHRRR